MNGRHAAGLAALLALSGCTTDGGGQPNTDEPRTYHAAPYVIEDGRTLIVCAPIAGKDDSQPGRWAFRFNHDGGWTEVPVPRADFDRHGVGDWVALRQDLGEVAEVSGGGCAR